MAKIYLLALALAALAVLKVPAQSDVLASSSTQKAEVAALKR